MPKTPEQVEKSRTVAILALTSLFCLAALGALFGAGLLMAAQAYVQAGRDTIVARKLQESRAAVLEKTRARFNELEEELASRKEKPDTAALKRILETMETGDNEVVMGCDLDKRPIHVSSYEAYRMLDQRAINTHLGAHLFRDEHSFQVDDYADFLAGAAVVPILLDCRVYKDLSCVVCFGVKQSEFLDYYRNFRIPGPFHVAMTLRWKLMAIVGAAFLVFFFFYIQLRHAWRNRPETVPARKPKILPAAVNETSEALQEELARESAERRRLRFECDELRSDLAGKVREEVVRLEAQRTQENAAWRDETLQRIAAGLRDRFQLAPESGHAAEVRRLLEALAEPDAPVHLETQPVALRQWLENVLEGVPVKVEPAFNVDGIVHLDETKMTPCLRELLANAKDAGVANVPIHIETARDDGFFEIRIVDRGEGIAEDVFPGVFQPLFSKRANHLGTGLGLARRIVRAHGGDLLLRTETGKGTATIVRIPARD